MAGRLGRRLAFRPLINKQYVGTASIVLSGSTIGGNETQIRSGGLTTILTVYGDTWVASGATFNAERQNIINGIDSAEAEATGWDAVVKVGQTVGGVVRTDNQTVTITWDAFASYNITAQETITVTVPSTALTLGAGIVASPTFVISVVAASFVIPPELLRPSFSMYGI